jgi:hypothetical protein
MISKERLSELIAIFKDDNSSQALEIILSIAAERIREDLPYRNQLIFMARRAVSG